MSRPFTGFLVLEAAVLGAWVGYTAVRRRALGRAQVLALAVFQLLVLLHGLAAALSFAGGHRAGEVGTHVAYLLASVLLLPLLMFGLGIPGSTDRYRPAAAALGCASVMVVLERTWVTWQT